MDEASQQSLMETTTTEYNINRKIFVGNVSYRVRSRRLSKFFSRFGEVEHCYVVKDHLKKWSRGIAFVTFKAEESMKTALQASDDELFYDGRQMRVKPAELSSKTKYWQDARHVKYSDDDSDDEDDEKTACSADAELTKDDRLLHESSEAMDCSSSSSSSTSINALFDELLIKIFALLSVKERIRVERVCTRWRHLAPQAWTAQKTLHFKDMFRRFGGLTDQKLDLLLSRCGAYLESLDLSASPRLLTNFAMDVIAKQCPDLLHLDLSSVKSTDVSLRNLVSRCSRLKNVSLKRCLHITDQGITNLLQGSPDIEQLDLTDLHTINGQCFQCVGEKLKTLILTNCHKMRDSSVEILAKRCNRLEDLHISNCRDLSDVGMRCVCQKFSSLKSLNFSGIGNRVSPSALECLANLHNLETVDLSQCHAVNDSVLAAISQGCKSLKHLNISSCNNVTDVGISTFVQLRSLESLDVSYLSKVSGEVFINLAVEGRLKKVVARATKFLTDEVVVSVANLCPRLRHLDLSGCFHITNRIFEGFRQDPGEESPRSVDLYLGGTSVDWIGQDVDWLSGFSHIHVYLHNLALEDLRPERELILPDYADDSSDEEEIRVHHQPALQPEPFEGYTDDWDEGEGGYDGFDDYLDNDDPLAEERWHMS